MKRNTLAHYGDILAIPFFLITLIYFYQRENKTLLENIIMIFIIVALLSDIAFTFLFFTTK